MDSPSIAKKLANFAPSRSVLLVDGSSFLYRAYYAMGKLSSKGGRPTGALYGFLAMMKSLASVAPFEYCCCVFDAKGKNFRHELYQDYKMNRPPMPDDLREQKDALFDIVPLFGWPLVAIEGVEADDVIATLAVAARAEGLRCLVATGDKDLAQLVDDNTFIIDTKPKESLVLDREAVKEKYGVWPEQIVDLLALRGDAADNVPGVPKWGDKTTQKWLGLFGSLEGVVARIEEIPGAAGKSLRDELGNLDLYKKLVSLKTDVDLSDCLPNGLAGLKTREPQYARLMAVLSSYDIESLNDHLAERYAKTHGLGAQQAKAELAAMASGALIQGRSASAPASAPRGEAASALPGAEGPEGFKSESGASVASFPALGEAKGAARFASDEAAQAFAIASAAPLVPGGSVVCRPIADYVSRFVFADSQESLAVLDRLESKSCFAFDVVEETEGDWASGAAGVALAWDDGPDAPSWDELRVFEPGRGGVDRAPLIAGIRAVWAPFAPAGAASGDAAWALAGDARDRFVSRLLGWVAEKKAVCPDVKRAMAILGERAGLEPVAGDCAIASFVLESHLSTDLEEAALRHLYVRAPAREEYFGKGAKATPASAADPAALALHGCARAFLALQLERTLYAKMDPKSREVYERIDLPLASRLRAMEETGVLLDKGKLGRMESALSGALGEIERETFALAGREFNLNSPKQLQEVLFDDLRVSRKGLRKTKSGGVSTDEETLEALAEDYPIAALLLRHRGLSKLKNTYAGKLGDQAGADGRVRTTYLQTVAVTGRLSSRDPNLQNIPVRTDEGKAIRDCFVAPPGRKLVSADYSQIELRIMAHMSGDANMIGAFERGEDIHRQTAAAIFGAPPDRVEPWQRRAAKAINFGLIYGMSAYGLAKNVGVDAAGAKRFIEDYFSHFPGAYDYIERTKERAAQRGYVETLYGRRLWIPDMLSDNFRVKARAERMAINAPMQGTASDLIKIAMNRVGAWLEKEKLKTRMLLQVHDELIFEAPEDELPIIKQKVPEIMDGAAKLKVPLAVEIGVGSNWGEAH